MIGDRENMCGLDMNGDGRKDMMDDLIFCEMVDRDLNRERLSFEKDMDDFDDFNDDYDDL